MIPVDYDFMSPAVRSALAIPFDVPDWTGLNLIPGGGPAASAYTRLIFGGQYFDVVNKKAAYAEFRACVAGSDSLNGNAQVRLAAWSNDPGQPIEWVYSDPVIPSGPPWGQKNIGADVTAMLNGLVAKTRVLQFMTQVKGGGTLAMARLQVDWKVTTLAS